MCIAAEVQGPDWRRDGAGFLTAMQLQFWTRGGTLIQSSNSAFDAIASTFEHHRALPEGASEAIRAAIWSATDLTGPARVLDIGAGTGRIGRAFVNAGDFYTGLDSSSAMLREFRISAPNCTLVQADATSLPFVRESFDVVLLMQVLSGAKDGRGVVAEARRVVRRGGCVAVGHTAGPELGVDSRLKGRLKIILDEMGVDFPRQEKARKEALAWLRSQAVVHRHCIAASWTAYVTAEAFLQRHRSGVRFAQLPGDVQERALAALREWALDRFGSLDTSFCETRNFEIDIFEF